MSRQQASSLWVSSFSPQKKPLFSCLRIGFLTTAFLSLPSEVGSGTGNMGLGYADFQLLPNFLLPGSLLLPGLTSVMSSGYIASLPLNSLCKHCKLRSPLRYGMLPLSHLLPIFQCFVKSVIHWQPFSCLLVNFGLTACLLIITYSLSTCFVLVCCEVAQDNYKRHRLFPEET